MLVGSSVRRLSETCTMRSRVIRPSVSGSDVSRFPSRYKCSNPRSPENSAGSASTWLLTRTRCRRLVSFPSAFGSHRIPRFESDNVSMTVVVALCAGRPRMSRTWIAASAAHPSRTCGQASALSANGPSSSPPLLASLCVEG